MPPVVRLIARMVALVLGLGLFGGLLAPASAQEPRYRLSSGDELDITVFRVPELSRPVAVDVEGRIAFPPIGLVPLEGATLEEAGARISALLTEQKVLTEAQVTVALRSARPVFVGGDVATPGAYPYRAQLSVRRAIALAGGLGLSRIRGLDEAAELRGERDMVSGQLMHAQLRAGRLAAELAGSADLAAGQVSSAFVSPQALAQALELETRALRANIAEAAEEKTHLERNRVIVADRIDTLFRQQQVQRSLMAQQTEEIQRMTRMQDQGLTSRPRVVEERRAFEAMQERESDTASEILRVQEQLEQIEFRLGRFDSLRTADLEAAYQDAGADVAALSARLGGVAERLAQLGIADRNQITVTLYRSADGRETAVAADQDTLLAPGDMLEVSIEIPAVQPGLATTKSSQ